MENHELDESGYFIVKKDKLASSSVSSTSASYQSNRKHPEYKIWISDLVTLTKSSDTDFYNFRGLAVNIVDIYGVVAEVITNNYGTLYKVDDGTGEIGCWQDKRNKQSTEAFIREVDTSVMVQILNNLSKSPNDSALTCIITEDDLDGSSSLLEVTQWLEGQILSSPECTKDSFELGDTLHVRGKLANFRGDQCIRVYNIRQVLDINEETDRRHEMIYLYKTFYDKIKSKIA